MPRQFEDVTLGASVDAAFAEQGRHHMHDTQVGIQSTSLPAVSGARERELELLAFARWPAVSGGMSVPFMPQQAPGGPAENWAKHW